MGVEYFEWGVFKGGTPDGGASPPAAASYGPEEVFEGTASGVVATLTFAAATKNVIITNVDDTGVLEYSLDGGAVWIPLEPYAGSGSIPVSITTLGVRRQAAADADYRVVATLTS